VTGPLRLPPRLLVAGILATLAAAVAGWLTLAHGSSPSAPATTPVQHVVVIYGENESFDHYFGTYPVAANTTPGEPTFTAAPGTPVPDNLTSNGLLGGGNPNSAPPERIARANALTCDQNHSYADEQKAFDDGLMDKFVEFTAGGSCADHSIVMDYFDGNTVTALWNLAQHFTLSDNFYGSTFGPSTPGALNLIAGTTHGAGPSAAGGIENGTMIGDPDPAFDDCAAGSAQMSGQNVGDLLNAKGVTWGWFQGGFRPTSVSGAGKPACGSAHKNIGGGTVGDYSPHHQPFMYYASTANPHHLPPTSTAMIGHGDQANHQYDLADFDNAVKADNLPQVSFLKAAQFEDAHPGSSDPVDEQRFVARVLDEVQQSPDWSSTAVILAYDDSDGWYDHRSVVSQHSDAPADQSICSVPPPAPGDHKDRCGPGPRLPLLVVSPWTRVNAVNGTQLEQASITRFIEDNWNLGRVGDQSFDARAASMNPLFDFDTSHARAPKVYLDPAPGPILPGPPSGLVSSPNGADPAPTPTPTPPAPAAPAPVATTPVVAPPPAKKPAIKPKLSVTAKRSGKKVTLTVKVTGLSTKNGKVTLSAKLVLKKKNVASSATGTVKAGKAKLTLKAKKTIKKGKYTLSVKVKQGTASATVTKALTLR
jgi:phospholipase C